MPPGRASAEEIRPRHTHGVASIRGVFAEPVGFDQDDLRRMLRQEWAIDAVALSYAPVGFGTHHYHAQTSDGGAWFVNVDELAAKSALGCTGAQVIEGLERSLGTAVALREAGLSFVHSPRRRTFAPSG
jgi:spectinomycin phosphotransferase